MHTIDVVVAVTIDGHTTEHKATTTTSNPPHRIAEGVLSGVFSETQESLRNQRYAAGVRRGAVR